ncbi:putative ribonuclease H-like domain-containing protein [Tanacetum coccineum]
MQKPFVLRTKAIYGRKIKQIYGGEESTKIHEEKLQFDLERFELQRMLPKNQGASIKTLEIQIGQMSKVLQERGFGSLPSSTETNPRDHVKSISTTVEADASSIRRIGSHQYCLNDYYCENKKGSYGPQFSEAYSYGASHIDKSIPRKEKDPGSFTLPCYINNVCFDNALADLGASVSVMPLSTYLNLGLGELAHTKLTVELADRTVKYPKEFAENVLVEMNGNSKKRVTKGTDGVYRVLPPATQEEQFADEKDRKARTLLLMAVPKDHLRRFHGMNDAKEIWVAMKTRFGGNANSKKMQKAVLKQQFKAFTISSKESLEKGYDRFQKLLSQLDALGAGVSDEDANHKFLRSLPPAWDSLAMTMRTKKNIDTLSIDDLYNNLSVFEQDISNKISFLPLSVNIILMIGFRRNGFKLAVAMTCHKDYEVLQEDRQKARSASLRFKVTVEAEAGKGQKFQSSCILKWKALMTIDEDSYNALQAKYDELQSEFGDRSCLKLPIRATLVKKLESQIRASHKQQSSLTEKLNFQANQIFEKDEKLKKYRRIGMKAVKDKDALQKIVDSWFASSKNLWKLIDCGMSSTVKIGLGYGIKSNAEVLGYEEEISRGIFAFRETDAGNYDIPLYSRFKQVEYKGVPHPLSGDYTPREQEDIDDSLYEYGKYGPQPQSPSPTESDASSTVYSTCQSNDIQLALQIKSGVLDLFHWKQMLILGSQGRTQAVRPESKEKLSLFDCAGSSTEAFEDKGSISGKGTIRLGNLVFDDVAFVKELGHFNLFSISQICDKKLNVLFTEKECFVVSSDFKMPDENQVLLKVPRQHNMYTFDMKNVVSSKGYTCLLAKASSDEAKLWHRRLGHLNFKNLNKLVKGNLVRGLPSKSFKNDHTCVACQKGKQHKASCSKEVIDIDVQTEEAADLMVVSSTSLTEATRKAAKKMLDALDCDNINTGFEERYSWQYEAIAPSAASEVEASYDDDGIITDFNNLPDEETDIQEKEQKESQKSSK